VFGLGSSNSNASVPSVTPPPRNEMGSISTRNACIQRLDVGVAHKWRQRIVPEALSLPGPETPSARGFHNVHRLPAQVAADPLGTTALALTDPRFAKLRPQPPYLIPFSVHVAPKSRRKLRLAAGHYQRVLGPYGSARETDMSRRIGESLWVAKLLISLSEHPATGLPPILCDHELAIGASNGS